MNYPPRGAGFTHRASRAAREHVYWVLGCRLQVLSAAVRFILLQTTGRCDLSSRLCSLVGAASNANQAHPARRHDVPARLASA